MSLANDIVPFHFPGQGILGAFRAGGIVAAGPGLPELFPYLASPHKGSFIFLRLSKVSTHNVSRKAQGSLKLSV